MIFVYLVYILIALFSLNYYALELEQSFNCFHDNTSCPIHLMPHKSLELPHKVEAQRFPLSDKNIDAYDINAPNKGLSQAQINRIRYIVERDVPSNWLVLAYFYTDKDFRKNGLDYMIDDVVTSRWSINFKNIDNILKVYSVSVSLETLIDLLEADEIKHIKITQIKYDFRYDYY